MQKNINFKWEKQAKRLTEDAVFAENFTKFILSDVLHESVEVESVLVYLQKGEYNKEDKVKLLATVVACGVRRTMEISLYKRGYLECDRNFKCCYYCVEAPSILLDSGRTSMNLEVREDLLERWSSSCIK